MIETRTLQDKENKENNAIFRTEITVPINQTDDDIDDLVILRDEKGQINRSAYARLHKLSTTSENRLSISNLNQYKNFTRSPINRSDSHLCVKEKQKKLETKIIPVKKKCSDDESVNSIPCVLQRSESIDTVDKIELELSNFVMDNKKKDKKRTNSFRKLFSVSFFGKDKKKKTSKEAEVIRQENSDFAENYQNETQFARNTPQRHTITCDHYKNRSFTNPPHPHPPQPPQRSIEEDPPPEIVQQYANFHINKFNKIRNSFEETNEVEKNENFNNVAHPFVTKYIDTSSSTNTLESEKLNRHVENSNDDKFKLVRNESFRRETPPRAQETRQVVNIVKPKARLPINYGKIPESAPESKFNVVQNQPQLNDVYGTVFDAIPRKSDVPRSPRSPSLEMTKLKLPPNREITTLQPRLRSPSPYTKVSTEKLIATELLKIKDDIKPQATSTPTVSDAILALRNELETTDQNLKQELSQIKSTLQNMNITSYRDGNLESPRGTLGSRSSISSPPPRNSDVELRHKPTRPSGCEKKPPNSPSKDEIRRSVEAYYWKEIKRIKEQEDYEIYMSQLHFSQAGYAEDPIFTRRSRRMDDNRNRRSSSVPRNAQRNLSFDTNDSRSLVIPEGRTVVYGYVTGNNTQRNNSRRTNGDYGTYKPIFRRGSLSGGDYQPIVQANKKVSFSNSSNSQIWPTKNGYTKSPPQRRLERVPNTTLDGDVFLPNRSDYAIYAPRPNYSSDSEAIYGQRFRTLNHQELENLRNSQIKNVPQRLSRHESIQLADQPYGYHQYGDRRGSYYENTHMQSPTRIPVRRDILITDNIYGQHVGYYGYPNMEPLYGSRPKQVTVRNKVCDIYGKIHDTGNIQTGVLMGQLQNSPTSPQNFRRGTRLTSSNNDMLLRRRQDFQNRLEENSEISHPNSVRPLPPLPPNGKNDKNSTTKKNQNSKKKKK